MSKARAYYRADGRVAIVMPAPKSRREGETEAKWLKRTYEKTSVHKEGLLFDDIDTDDLPQDRSTRDKWRKKTGGGVKIDNTIKTDAEKRQKIEDDLDTELAKPNPDAVKALKLKRKLEKNELD